ncbi:unnamed protein product, partial [Brassica napus]
VDNEKIECEASAYQKKLLMKRVEDSLGNMKSRAVHNSVMELRNIYHNHPYLSQLHTDEVIEIYINANNFWLGN